MAKMFCRKSGIMLALLGMLVFTTTTHVLQKKEFVTLHKWTNLKFTFPNDALLQLAIERGYYEPNKPIPVDTDIEYGDDGNHRTFLTIPRLSLGIPYSLAVVTDSDKETVLNPKLEPYPSYEWHSSHGGNCSSITSAIRTFIDECWRLWIIDSGQMNSMQYCAPQIMAFDLVTDKLIHRYMLPPHLYVPGVSVFTALVVDVGDAEPKIECRDTKIYIADPWGYGLIVYDALARKSWRIEHDTMLPDSHLQKWNAASDGIFTVSLSPKDKGKVRHLYYHSLNSFQEVSIPLHIVNNATLWTTNDPKAQPIGIRHVRLVGSRGTQCESEAMDRDGNLFCSLISSNALINWKEGSKYSSDTLRVIAYSPYQLKFVTGLKVNRNAAEEDELWALSSNPSLFVGGKAKKGEIKFQIIGCRVKNLIENENCTVMTNTKWEAMQID